MKKPAQSINGGTVVPFLLVHGFELAISFSLTVVAVVFTIFPDALTHAPIGFESRGILHHVFHYMLLFGAVGTFSGLVLDRPKVELAGLSLLLAALFINLMSVTTLGGDEDTQQGFAIALRSAVVVGLGARAYLLGFYLPRLGR